MAEWYFSYGGSQEGPFNLNQAIGRARANPRGLVWRHGFVQWTPITQVPELNPGASSYAAPPAARPTSDVVDYQIHGKEMQFVEVELDPGESAVGEAGTMMYKDPQVQMQTVFGDASNPNANFMDKLLGAGKRLVTGESLFMTVFTNADVQRKAHVAFAAPYPGNILAIALPDVGGRLICQKDSFLCAARGVSIGIFFQRRILTGLFGGEGFIMEKLEGDGVVFVHAGGTVIHRSLGPGEVLHVDTGCVVAFEESVDFDLERVGGVKSMIFGGEGVFFATLRGPGRVWLQSLPFSRLAGRMLAAVPGRGTRREEGSVLGGFGDLLSGDRD